MNWYILDICAIYQLKCIPPLSLSLSLHSVFLATTTTTNNTQSAQYVSIHSVSIGFAINGSLNGSITIVNVFNSNNVKNKSYWNKYELTEDLYANCFSHNKNTFHCSSGFLSFKNLMTFRFYYFYYCLNASIAPHLYECIIKLVNAIHLGIDTLSDCSSYLFWVVKLC